MQAVVRRLAACRSKALLTRETRPDIQAATKARLVACHPWRPPSGPSLRDVKNRSRRFFVIGLVISGADTLA